MALADALASMMAGPAPPMQAPAQPAPPADPNDMTGQYNTPLSPADEARFQAWAQQNPRLGNTYDYDARGFFLNGAKQGANGHGDDKWKKPNHNTFSTGSMYSTPDSPGGRWAQTPDGKWSFYASPANLKYQDQNDLKAYWNREEAPHGNQLILPPASGLGAP